MTSEIEERAPSLGEPTTPLGSGSFDLSRSQAAGISLLWENGFKSGRAAGLAEGLEAKAWLEKNGIVIFAAIVGLSLLVGIMMGAWIW